VEEAVVPHQGQVLQIDEEADAAALGRGEDGAEEAFEAELGENPPFRVEDHIGGKGGDGHGSWSSAVASFRWDVPRARSLHKFLCFRGLMSGESVDESWESKRNGLRRNSGSP